MLFEEVTPDNIFTLVSDEEVREHIIKIVNEDRTRRQRKAEHNKKYRASHKDAHNKYMREYMKAHYKTKARA